MYLKEQGRCHPGSPFWTQPWKNAVSEIILYLLYILPLAIFLSI